MSRTGPTASSGSRSGRRTASPPLALARSSCCHPRLPRGVARGGGGSRGARGAGPGLRVGGQTVPQLQSQPRMRLHSTPHHPNHTCLRPAGAGSATSSTPRSRPTLSTSSATLTRSAPRRPPACARGPATPPALPTHLPAKRGSSAPRALAARASPSCISCPARARRAGGGGGRGGGASALYGRRSAHTCAAPATPASASWARGARGTAALPIQPSQGPACCAQERPQPPSASCPS